MAPARSSNRRLRSGPAALAAGLLLSLAAFLFRLNLRRSSNRLTRLASPIFLLAFGGCDPSYHYVPVGSEEGEFFLHWESDTQDLSLKIEELYGLSVSPDVTQSIHVTNHSTKPFVLEGVTFTTLSGRQFHAQLPRDPAGLRVSSGEESTILIGWSFVDSPPRALQDRPAMKLSYSLGTKRFVLKVPYHAR